MLTASDALLCVLLALSLVLAVGCGNEALRMNAEVARAMLEIQAASGPVIRDARISASVDAARAVQERGGLESEAQAVAQATAQSWQCSVDGHRHYATAVSAYIDTLSLWSLGQDFSLSDVLPYVSRAIDSYTFLASCLTSLGNDMLPAVPTFLGLIPSGWSFGNE